MAKDKRDLSEFDGILNDITDNVPSKSRGGLTVSLPPKPIIDKLGAEFVGKMIPTDTALKLFSVKGAEGKTESSLINNLAYKINNELEKIGYPRFIRQKNIGTKSEPKKVLWVGQK